MDNVTHLPVSSYGFTIFELVIIKTVIDQSSTEPTTGFSLDQLRLFKSLRDKVNSVTPEKPMEPAIPKPKFADKVTPEESVEATRLNEEYLRSLRAYYASTQSVTVTNDELAFLRHLFKSFNRFTAGEPVVNAVTSLAEKLGV